MIQNSRLITCCVCYLYVILSGVCFWYGYTTTFECRQYCPKDQEIVSKEGAIVTCQFENGTTIEYVDPVARMNSGCYTLKLFMPFLIFNCILAGLSLTFAICIFLIKVCGYDLASSIKSRFQGPNPIPGQPPSELVTSTPGGILSPQPTYGDRYTYGYV